MSIVINTPSGHIGQHLTRRLLEAGETVTLISRHPEKVEAFTARGARLVEGSLDDPAVLDRALEGAESLFWLTPPAIRPDFPAWARGAAVAAAEAARAHGVERAVVLSSVGAQNGPGAGPVSALLPVEEAFREALPHVAVLRAGFFMENFLRDLDSLAGEGTVYQPVPADHTVPMVATRDIADRAAAHLLDRGWSGHRVTGAHGPRDLSYGEAAQVLSRALERPVRYVEVTPAQARQAMLGAGLPDFAADLFLEMYGAMSEGRMDPAEPRTPETTTPTSLERFAREVLAPALAAARLARGRQPRKIAVLGAGNVGGTLGRRWAELGHRVVFGVRDPTAAKVAALVSGISGEARADTVAEAAAGAEIVVLATPWEATSEVLEAAGDLTGKIVVDCTNPIAPGLKGLAVGGETSGGEEVARRAPGARVVKAFNTTGFNIMEEPARGGQRATMFVAGDDPRARAVVAALAEDLGFDPCDCGPLYLARYLEPTAMLWIDMAILQGHGREMAFRLLRR